MRLLFRPKLGWISPSYRTVRGYQVLKTKFPPVPLRRAYVGASQSSIDVREQRFPSCVLRLRRLGDAEPLSERGGIGALVSLHPSYNVF